MAAGPGKSWLVIRILGPPAARPTSRHDSDDGVSLRAAWNTRGRILGRLSDSDGSVTRTAQWAARSKNSARARPTEIMDGRLGDAESSLDQFQVQSTVGAAGRAPGPAQPPPTGILRESRTHGGTVAARLSEHRLTSCQAWHDVRARARPGRQRAGLGGPCHRDRKQCTQPWLAGPVQIFGAQQYPTVNGTCSPRCRKNSTRARSTDAA